VLREDDAELLVLTFRDNEALTRHHPKRHRDGGGEGRDINLLGELVEGVRIGASRQCAGRYLFKLDTGG
jgi:hypothetical protein